MKRKREARGGGAGAMRVSRADSSSQVARRQTARLLRIILRGDATRHATASIKSLIYQPSIRNKKATMALTCQTLKYLPIIKEVLENCGLLKSKSKIHIELLYVATFELLFGKNQVMSGGLEDFVLAQKNSLRTALARLLVKKNVSRAEDLLRVQNGDVGPARVRYVRVNTLKIEVENALGTLRQSFQVDLDTVVPGLLTVPAEVDLHAHPLVSNGSLLLQGKASCIPAVALAPEADWVVLDACAAPGNKTVQLAALMNGKGQVLACELNEKRIERLHKTVEVAGASNVTVIHQDFLKLDFSRPMLSEVKAILLDPSCSGSGTVHRRLDHLLPSSANKSEAVDWQRLEKLACFQEKALRFALSFPAVERVVYSTCSIHQRENEDVVRAVLDFASSKGFRLGSLIPQWQHRGLPVFEGASNLLRIEPSADMDGFFVALFERGRENLVGTIRTDLPLARSGKDGGEPFRKGKTNKHKRKRKGKKLAPTNLL